MKQLVFIITVSFFAVMLAIGAAGYLANHGEGARSAGTAEERPRIQTPELARHASSSDCWIAIQGEVYDVTRYIDEHPAPRETIVRACGTDATEAFATKGDLGRAHSPHARARLEEMKVGIYAP